MARSSAVHQMGFDVCTHTMASSGTRWFEVDTSPSKEEVVSAIWQIVNTVQEDRAFLT